MTGLPIYVVYRNPSDYPGKYVVRRCVCSAGRITFDAAPLVISADYTVAAGTLPPGLHRIPPQPGEDPSILESWL